MSSVAVDRARRLLDAFRGRRVVVIGDAMLDRFIWGEVDRISPEAPVPVVRVRRESVHLGGAANVAANLSMLGARTTLVGVAGDDPSADQLLQELREAGIAAALEREAGRTTTVKTRVIARAQQVVRVDRESEATVDPATTPALIAAATDAMAEADAVVISDYDKGVVSPELLAAVLPRARKDGLPVVVDPKISHFPHYQPVTILTPNQAEAARATAMEIRSDEDCLRAARKILSQLDARAVLVTRGERGMLLLERGGEPRFIPAVAREVYDVTGAGDTVVAILALALASGGALEDAAVLANHAGGVVVGKVGTATAAVEEILHELENQPQAAET